MMNLSPLQIRILEILGEHRLGLIETDIASILNVVDYSLFLKQLNELVIEKEVKLSNTIPIIYQKTLRTIQW